MADDFDTAGLFDEVSRALRPGGRFALELNNRDRIIRDFRPESVTEHDGDLVIERRRLEPLTGRCRTERILLRDGAVRRVPFFVRLFTFTELRGWLLDAGFAEVTGYGDEGGPLEPGSRR